MTASAIDVVVVPDFAGAGRRLFEARTLLFLGSWLEHAGGSRAWPLHVVSIGAPPPSVAALTERCGAALAVHDALDEERRYLNKLRGLEIESRTGRILLLDADTLVLSDLSPALALGECFAALPAATNRIPMEVWKEVFAAAGAELPAERMLPLIGSLADDLPASVMRDAFREEAPVHWNSGVVLAPAGCELRRHWARAARILEERFAGHPFHDHVCRNDQPSLAVAAARIRAQGVRYTPLPYPLHGFDLLFAAGRLRYGDTAVYHAKTLFRRARDGTLDPLRELELYRAHQVPRLYPETRAQALVRRLGGRAHPRRAASILRLCQRLDELTRRYVVPALS